MLDIYDDKMIEVKQALVAAIEAEKKAAANVRGGRRMGRMNGELKTLPVDLTPAERNLLRQMIRGFARSGPLSDRDHRALLAIHEKLWTTPTEEKWAAWDKALAV